MKGLKPFLLVGMAVVVLGAGGCVTVRPDALTVASEVQPAPGERLIADEVVVLVDASGSMALQGKFGYAKELARSFVNGMPAETYAAGMMSYGGEWVHEWVDLPLEPFARERMLSGVVQLQFLGGSTPLAAALDLLWRKWAPGDGNGALVIVSDGKADGAATLDAATILLSNHLEPLCIHTVQVGDDADGGRLLHDLAALSKCGTSRTACDVSSAEGMEAFVHDVFYGGMGDSDGDGVPDSLDRCPNTPQGAKVNEHGCWVLGGLLFDSDQAVIKPEYKGLLDDVAMVLTENPGVTVRIDGHTDATASEEYNKGLSERRAKAVREALVARGIKAKRLRVKGFGESRPAASNDTRAGRAQNRRVELTVLD